ncbi:(2Fe-2S)-binding protein [Aquibaculum arenosum]|nr:(2Fe-2S)-binding protein [Fodinicurvata sp. CAU 1616]
MYVCLCNGFTCRDVRRVVGEGAASVAAVYLACGARPNCVTLR